jgi:hypothetical protein
MQNETESTDPSARYAAAYSAHYTGHDLPLALERYRMLIASNPDADEATYSRMQIQNIANAVIPQQTLLDAHIDLVLVHFQQDDEME